VEVKKRDEKEVKMVKVSEIAKRITHNMQHITESDFSEC